MSNPAAVALIVAGAFLLTLGTLIAGAIDFYGFAATGTWHWYAIADYAGYLGADKYGMEAAFYSERWPGIAKVGHWLVFECPMEWWTVGLGVAAAGIGAGNE